jgi:hypothetical protein
LIPERTIRSLDSYVRARTPTGDFLESVLSNDLKGAIAYADAENLEALPAIVSYVVNHMPARCQGSPERYRRWLNYTEDEER